jgi:hypothetical protein
MRKFENRDLVVVPSFVDLVPSLHFQTKPFITKWTPDEARALANFLLDWARDVDQKRIFLDDVNIGEQVNPHGGSHGDQKK